MAGDQASPTCTPAACPGIATGQRVIPAAGVPRRSDAWEAAQFLRQSIRSQAHLPLGRQSAWRRPASPSEMDSPWEFSPPVDTSVKPTKPSRGTTPTAMKRSRRRRVASQERKRGHAAPGSAPSSGTAVRRVSQGQAGDVKHRGQGGGHFRRCLVTLLRLLGQHPADHQHQCLRHLRS